MNIKQFKPQIFLMRRQINNAWHYRMVVFTLASGQNMEQDGYAIERSTNRCSQCTPLFRVILKAKQVNQSCTPPPSYVVHLVELGELDANGSSIQIEVAFSDIRDLTNPKGKSVIHLDDAEEEDAA